MIHSVRFSPIYTAKRLKNTLKIFFCRKYNSGQDNYFNDDTPANTTPQFRNRQK